MLNSLSSKKIPQKKTCYKILPTSGGTSQTNFYVHFQPILEGINFGKKKKKRKNTFVVFQSFHSMPGGRRGQDVRQIIINNNIKYEKSAI